MGLLDPLSTLALTFACALRRGVLSVSTTWFKESAKFLKKLRFTLFLACITCWFGRHFSKLQLINVWRQRIASTTQLDRTPRFSLLSLIMSSIMLRNFL